MTIKITRSFSKKIQLKQFEPIESFCSAESEIEILKDGDSFMLVHETSKILDGFCQKEVEKTLAKFNETETICSYCEGISSTEKVVDGLHPSCKKEAGYKKKDL